jgi:hypothetical protein
MTNSYFVALERVTRKLPNGRVSLTQLPQAFDGRFFGIARRGIVVERP